MWSGWNGQSRWIREIDKFNWRVFFVDGGVWVVPTDGREGTDVDVSSGGGRLMSEENVSSKSAKGNKKDTEENKNGFGWIRHDDC